MTVKTYNPEWVNLTIRYEEGGEVENLPADSNDWEQMVARYVDPRYVHSTSTSGMVTRTKTVNKLGQFELEVPQGSSLLSFLSDKVGKDGKFTITVAEIQTSGTLSENVLDAQLSGASITEPGDITRAREASMRTFIFEGLLKKAEELAYVE